MRALDFIILTSFDRFSIFTRERSNWRILDNKNTKFLSSPHSPYIYSIAVKFRTCTYTPLGNITQCFGGILTIVVGTGEIQSERPNLTQKKYPIFSRNFSKVGPIWYPSCIYSKSRQIKLLESKEKPVASILDLSELKVKVTTHTYLSREL